MFLSIVMLLSILTSVAVFTTTAATKGPTGIDIVTYARQFIGYPYVYATQGPDSFDCSGFVKYVFGHFGISLPASSSSYWNNPSNYGVVIDKGTTSKARAGDLISWSGHVAIYTGNGYCIEALNQRYGVTERFIVDSHTNGLNYKVIRINGVSYDSMALLAGVNKSYVTVGETVKFWYAGLKGCSKVEYYFEKSGEIYDKKDITDVKGFSSTFEKGGKYNLYVGGLYNGEWIYSNKIPVIAFNAKLTSDKTDVAPNEDVTFTYSGLANCTKVNICFEKNGSVYSTIDSTKSKTYKGLFPSTGEYYVYASGTIRNFTATTNRIKVNVTCEHKYSSEVIEKATCSKVGKRKYTCSKCGYSYTKDIQKKDHTPVIDKAIPATCTKEGKTEGSHCSVCKAVIKAQQTVKKKSHKLETEETIPATLTKDGSITKKCTVCGKIITEKIYKPTSFTTSVKKYLYTGKVKTPKVTVTDSNGKVIDESNYSATYSSGRKNVGKYKITIKFKGIYSGTKTIYFYIVPKGTTISALTKSSKSFTVEWEKQETQTTGYHIQYSPSADFSTDKKSVYINDINTILKKITKLEPKKKYYVKIRTYKIVNDTKYYSRWSEVKSITTKE